MRESENLERQFEPKSQDEFISPAIGTTIIFQKDAPGSITLIIRKNGVESKAERRTS
jgi:hypothetical protein